MPHLVIERLRAVPEFFGGGPCIAREGADQGKRSPACALVVEVVDLLGGIIFIVGSLCFFPDEDITIFKAGCELFIAGSILYALVSVYALAEATEKMGAFSLEACENSLYVIGSVVFLVGTVLFWPQNVDADALDAMFSESFRMRTHIAVYLNTLNPAFEGSILFIIGCLCFACAAFVNGLNIRHFNDISSQMLSAVTSMYMCGSLLFVMGSMAFLPDFGCSSKMVALGAWLYTIGSVFFTIGSGISFVRTYREINRPEWQPMFEPHGVESYSATKGGP